MSRKPRECSPYTKLPGGYVAKTLPAKKEVWDAILKVSELQDLFMYQVVNDALAAYCRAMGVSIE